MWGAIALAVLVGLFALWLARLVFASRTKEPPTVRCGLPLVGPMLKFNEDPYKLFRWAERTYGQVFILDLLLLKFTVIVGKEGSQLFYDATDDVLDFNSAVKDLSLVVLGEESWDPAWIQKGTFYVSKGFVRHDRLMLYNSIIVDEVAKHVKNWMSMEKVDLFKAVSKMVTSINIRCVMGDDAYAHADEISSIYYKLEQSATDTLAHLFPWLPTPTKTRNARGRERLVEIISGVLRSRPEDQETPDYIGMVYRAEKDNFDIKIFCLHVVSILFAAHTNTAGTLTWTLANLANNKAIQDKAYREQAQLAEEMGDDAKALKPNFIAKLDYIDACMKETGRRYPLMMLLRRAARDVNFVSADGREFTIPKGRLVATSPGLAHHNEEYFPEPLRYDPERFTDPELRKSLVLSRAFGQFGFGRHKCLGERFANMVIKTALSRVLQLSQIEMVGPLSEPDFRKQSGVPLPKQEVWVKLVPRT